ncbi:hypothetical protein [Streptomyces sp. NPDC050546]|uniref:hypothetical protein n=1 Tax=Streptomyces sp. NPDC050546 TaxID=3365628 RepID=UPI0037B3DB67
MSWIQESLFPLSDVELTPAQKARITRAKKRRAKWYEAESALPCCWCERQTFRRDGDDYPWCSEGCQQTYDATPEGRWTLGGGVGVA